MKKKNLSKFVSLCLVAVMTMGLSTTALAATITPDQLPVDTTAKDYVGNIHKSDTGEAGSASTILEASFEPTMIWVKASPIIRTHTDLNGVVTNLDSMDGVNKGLAQFGNEGSKGAVYMTSLTVVPATGQSIVDFDSDFDNMPMGTKAFGMKINGVKVPTNGVVFTRDAAPDDSISTTFDITKGAKADTEEYEDYTFTYSAGSKAEATAFPVINHGSILPLEYVVNYPVSSGAVTDEQIAILVSSFALR